jgi:HemY protein
MWRFFWFLVLLILSVWLGLKISQDPGYALFTYRHWSMEMPLWFALVAFFIFLFLFYGILRFFDSIDFSIYRFKNWLRWRRKYKSYSKTNRGLIELIEGHWKSAEYCLMEGIEQSDAPLINYLAAAKAAQEQQAYDRRDT